MSREYFLLYDAASLSQSRMHLGNKAIVVLSLIDVSESGIFLSQIVLRFHFSCSTFYEQRFRLRFQADLNSTQFSSSDMVCKLHSALREIDLVPSHHPGLCCWNKNITADTCYVIDT